MLYFEKVFASMIIGIREYYFFFYIMGLILIIILIEIHSKRCRTKKIDKIFIKSGLLNNFVIVCFVA